MSEDPADYEAVVTEALVGHLGIITPEGYPRVVPLNFVTLDKTVYFHGAAHGEMYDVLHASPKVTFSVDLPYSVIPSYWTSKISAGTATMFYKSVLFKGCGVIVDDLDEKITALSLLTEKYQPEGGYRPITRDEPTYVSLLKNTAVFRVDTDTIDVRVNFRQKKNADYRRRLIENLEKRAQGPDLATAEIIRRMLDNQAPPV